MGVRGLHQLQTTFLLPSFFLGLLRVRLSPWVCITSISFLPAVGVCPGLARTVASLARCEILLWRVWCPVGIQFYSETSSCWTLPSRRPLEIYIIYPLRTMVSSPGDEIFQISQINSKYLPKLLIDEVRQWNVLIFYAWSLTNINLFLCFQFVGFNLSLRRH